MVSNSPWPILLSCSSGALAVNFLNFLNNSGSFTFLLLSVISSILILFQWWRDVIRESTFQGWHSSSVCMGLYMGMIMFILSEVMFFFSFFFGFFFSCLNPDIEIGSEWPPVGVQPLSWLEVPFLNTVLLLSSGVSITWVHHSLLESKKSEALISGVVTVMLGMIFTMFQYKEYAESAFTMADSVYGSLFFLMTGFHGIHVMIGGLFILVMILRIKKNHFSKTHHVGFEASAWYWHFVDVVWLMLYVCVYWWGS